MSDSKQNGGVEVQNISGVTENLPTNFYKRALIVCSILFSNALLFVYLAGNCHFFDDHPSQVLGMTTLVSAFTFMFTGV